MKPIWLLDVDGVINASRPGWGEAPHHANVFENGVAQRSWRIRWSPSCVKRIKAIIATGAVDIRWSTTWLTSGSVSNIELALNLPALGRAFVVGPGDFHSDTYKAKIAAARAVCEAGIPLIWTDDQMSASDLEPGSNALVIAPDPHMGLQPRDFDAIEKFIELNRELTSGQ